MKKLVSLFALLVLSLGAVAQVGAQQQEICLLDVVIAIDESASVDSSEFVFLRDFTVGIANGLPVAPGEVNLGAVEFASSAAQLFALTDNQTQAATDLANNPSQFGGSTNHSAALQTSATVVGAGRGAVQDAIIMITDGITTAGGDPVPVADAIRASGVEIFTVGVTSSVNESILIAIAGSADNYFFADDFGDLPDVIDGLLQGACEPVTTQSISGTVFEDTNENGVQDAGEPGISGAGVVLYESADLSTVVASVSTNANGDYTFPILPGNYVLEVLLTGVLDTRTIVPGGSFDPLTAQTAPIALASGQDIVDVDAPIAPEGPVVQPGIDCVYIQFNHPDEITMTSNERPQVTVQFGNRCQTVLHDIDVYCQVDDGAVTFLPNRVWYPRAFQDTNFTTTAHSFENMSRMIVGQNYNVSFVTYPQTGESTISCSLYVDGQFGDSDSQAMRVRR